MFTRRQILGTAAAAPLVRPAYAKDRKPNLLFLLADDHAGYVLGADGNQLARTPHLDRLASEGTRFAANYCNSPVCTPSRQCILTGRLPHSAGVTVLETPLSEDRMTLAKILQHEGASTGVIGKMHFNQPGRPGLHGFDMAWTEDVVTRQWQKEVGPAPAFPNEKTKPTWRPFQDPARIWLNAEALPFPRHTEQMRSSWVTRQACRFLEEHKNDRFALWVSFQEPHSPFDFPVEWRGKHQPSDFPNHPVGPEDSAQIPLIFRDLTGPEKQGIAAAYYTSTNFLDHNVGIVLQKLRQLDLENDTLVVYMADHGYSLGQHGRFEKHCGYDPALRVPLIIRWPGKVARGVVRDFTESVDVPPTILDLLGAEPLPLQHGQSLLPYLNKSKPRQVRTSVFSEYLENEEVILRTSRWKFIHCSGQRERTDGYKTDNPTPGRYVRLYDLHTDPGEFHNVAGRHPDVVAKMSAELMQRFRATHPDAESEPGQSRAGAGDLLDWYVRPRDARKKA
jgi:choline-sulfatase